MLSLVLAILLALRKMVTFKKMSYMHYWILQPCTASETNSPRYHGRTRGCSCFNKCSLLYNIMLIMNTFVMEKSIIMCIIYC